MDYKRRVLFVGGTSGVFGGIMGSVSGSNSLFVVAVVSAFFALIFYWFAKSFIK